MHHALPARQSKRAGHRSDLCFISGMQCPPSPSNFKMRAHIHPDSRLSSLIHLPHMSKHQFFEEQVAEQLSASSCKSAMMSRSWCKTANDGLCYEQGTSCQTARYRLQHNQGLPSELCEDAI